MVVDGRVDIAVADATRLVVVVVADRATERLPAPAVGDPAELLDVDVDELAGSLALVAPDHLTGRSIEPAQSVEPQAHEHAVHRGRGDAQAIADPCWSELECRAQLGYLGFDGRSCPVRTAVRSTRAIDETVDSLLAEASPPLVARRPRDPHLRCNVRHWPALLDPQAERQSANRRESGVSVHFEPPGVVWLCQQLHTAPGGSPHARTGRVNNVRGHYS